jgi:hypothetical protein
MSQKTNIKTAIKCHFSNEVHKLLEPNINVKARERWKHRDLYKLTDAQKLELFEKILQLHFETSRELTFYLYNKREKKRINKARVERGWEPKKKTSKEEYLKMKA